jgi:hypothetical protein
MSGFATLEPAFIALVSKMQIQNLVSKLIQRKLTFDPPFPIGNLNSGIGLQVAPVTGGSFTTVSSFSGPSLEAEFLFGDDHVHIDPGMKNVRVNVQAVLKNKGGSLIHYTYKGILEMTPESIAILTGSPDAKTTEFGKIFTHVNFETGAQEIKELETGIFVGCSRFLVEEGKAPVVESRISRVVYK